MTDRTGNDHCTPQWVLEPLRAAFGRIGLDPCWNQWSSTDPVVAYDGASKGDGLLEPWSVGGWVFVNPPFGRGLMKAWARRWADYASQGLPLVALTQLEARTEWSQAIADAAQYRIDLIGYARFDGAKDGGAMHPHALHIANLHGNVTHERFRKWGRL